MRGHLIVNRKFEISPALRRRLDHGHQRIIGMEMVHIPGRNYLMPSENFRWRRLSLQNVQRQSNHFRAAFLREVSRSSNKTRMHLPQFGAAGRQGATQRTEMKKISESHNAARNSPRTRFL